MNPSLLSSAMGREEMDSYTFPYSLGWQPNVGEGFVPSGDLVKDTTLLLWMQYMWYSNEPYGTRDHDISLGIK